MPSHIIYLLISLRKSTSLPNRQLIVYYYLLKYQVESSVGGVDFLKLRVPARRRLRGTRRAAARRPEGARRPARAPLQEMRGAQDPDLLKRFVRIIIRTIVGF